MKYEKYPNSNILTNEEKHTKQDWTKCHCYYHALSTIY